MRAIILGPDSPNPRPRFNGPRFIFWAFCGLMLLEGLAFLIISGHVRDLIR
jgi:hypothetical protein